MRDPNWIGIANIVAAFIALFIELYWHSRRSRATATPAAKPPNRTRKLIGRLTYLAKTYAWAAFTLSLPWVGIWWELRRPGPPDGWSMVFIILNAVLLSVAASVLLTVLLFAYSIKLRAEPRRDRTLD